MTPPSTRPRVSGIMAARNTAEYVGAAIESALGQTHADFELLVVDDASTDGTAEIVAGYAKRDARVRLFRGAECVGQSVARNLALREARGEWIAVLDSDDLWRPDRLKRQLAVVDANPSVRLVTSEYRRMTAVGLPLGTFLCTRPEWWLQWWLLFHNVIGGHSQVLFQREAALACGGYRSDFSLAEDYRLWVSLARAGEIACIHDVLMDYRVHDRSVSAQNGPLQWLQEKQFSEEAISALVGEGWPPERPAALRNFWLKWFTDVAGSVPQLGHDMQQLEQAFWRNHPASASPENRTTLADHIRRRWALYALHLKYQGHGQASVSAWRYATS